MNEWLPLLTLISLCISLVGVGVAIGTRNQMLTQLKSAVDKMNGLPQRMTAMEREMRYNEDWRHDVAVPQFSDLRAEVMSVQTELRLRKG